MNCNTDARTAQTHSESPFRKTFLPILLPTCSSVHVLLSSIFHTDCLFPPAWKMKKSRVHDYWFFSARQSVFLQEKHWYHKSPADHCGDSLQQDEQLHHTWQQNQPFDFHHQKILSENLLFQILRGIIQLYCKDVSR